jgi:hypothetical protein
MPPMVRRVTATDADLDLVRVVLDGPHDELELTVLVVDYRDTLLEPLRQIVRHWRATGGPELLAHARLVEQALDRATGIRAEAARLC